MTNVPREALGALERAERFVASTDEWRQRAERAESALREIAEYRHGGSFRVAHYDALKTIAAAALASPPSDTEQP